MSKAVRQPTDEALALHKPYPLIGALLGGTDAMREAGEKYLPKWPNEQQEAWDARKKTATLFPGFARTVEILAAKPFSKPLTLENISTALEPLLEDSDLQGRDLHAFGGSVLQEAVSHGLSLILCEYPRAGELRTRAAEIAAGVRPYLVQIHPQQVLGWRFDDSGKFVQLRILDTVTVDDGEFGTKTIEQVKVLYAGAWETYRMDEKGDWQLHESGLTSLNFIPVVPVYGNRTGAMKSKPPLMELAHMNVEHWQSKSDQQTILHVARVPILTLIGSNDDTQLTVGGSAAVKLPEGGDLKFTEHSGAAIESGRKSILDLEDQMRQAGAELLVIKSGNNTVAQTMSDNEQSSSAIQRIANDLEDALTQAIGYMAQWMGETTEAEVCVYKDFGAATLAEASAELLKDFALGGLVSMQTAFEELKRRNILSPDRDWKVELDRLSEQSEAMPAVELEDEEDEEEPEAVPEEKDDKASQAVISLANKIANKL